MGGWAVLVNLLFPIPFVFLLLLCIPLPTAFGGKTLRRIILTIVDKVLFTKILGAVNLYQFSTLLSCILFVLTAIETSKASSKYIAASDAVELKEERMRCNKWRAERNFWISLMSTTLWIIMYRFHAMAKELQAVQNKISSDSRNAKNQ